MKYIFILFILCALCSCKVIERKIFSPTQINNPSLQQKNDHCFSIAHSRPSGFDFTGGYAITNRLAVIGGAYIHKNRDNEEEFSIFSNYNASSRLLYRHKGFHGGLGIYFPLSKKNAASFASFFGGYTQGSFRMDERYFENAAPSASPTRESFYKSNISRYFLQGSINAYSKNYEISFISRYSYVGYANVITDYTIDQQYSFNLPPLGYPEFSQFLDLAFDSKFFLTNDPQIGLQIFGSVTTRLKRRDFNFHYYPFRIGIGVIIKNLFKNNSKKNS